MQLQAAYAAFSHGLSIKWFYLVVGACLSLENYTAPVEVAVCNDFLPALTGHAISDLERELLAFLARLKRPWFAQPDNCGTGCIKYHNKDYAATHRASAGDIFGFHH